MASILLVASYVLDWVILITFAVIGYVVGNIRPNKRPFHLDDPTIDFPYENHDTVSLPVLFIVSIVVPAAVIFLVAMLFIPGPTVTKGTPKPYIWRRKLWEWHAGWLGLALSVVAAWVVTSGMKNLFGKPRPNLLGRCQPDLTNMARYFVGSISNTSKNGRLVSADICLNLDESVVDEAFRSFPSGHSSTSAAGLVYLSLVLAAKLRAGAPYLSHHARNYDRSSLEAFPLPDISHSNSQFDALEETRNTALASSQRQYQKHAKANGSNSSARNQAAGPPVYLLVIALLPFAATVFISSSRWYDFQHHGFDIIFGFLIGTLTSILAFRHYHLPLSRGAGWAWGPRSTQRALWAGVGRGGYSTPTLSSNNDEGQNRRQNDIANDGQESYQLREV